MDLRKLKTLIDLVSESNVSELEITEAEGKVRIVKGGSAGAVPMQQAGMQPVLAVPPAAVAAPVVAAAAPVPRRRLRHPRATSSSRRWWAPSTALPARAARRSSKWAARSRKAT